MSTPATPTHTQLVFTAVPDEALADSLAYQLVESGLAACVKRLAACQATYRWDGQIERTTEIPLLIVACIWYLVITSILMVIQSRLEKHFGKGFDARPAGARGKRTPLPGKTFGEPKDDVDKQNEATFAGMTA